MSSLKELVSVYVQELYPYGKAEIEELVGAKNDHAFQVHIAALKDIGVLSVRGKKAVVDRNEIADFIARDLTVKEFTDDNVYVFSFVGVVVVEGRVYKCYPKYMKHYPSAIPVPEKKELKQVLYAIEKYNDVNDKHNTWVKEFNQLEERKNFNFLSLILFLIADYYEHGLYKEYHRMNEINGEGEVQWERTIDEFIPVITNRRPVYPMLITNRIVTEEDNYFERLHACVITKAIEYMRQADLLDIFENIVDEALTEEELSDFGEDGYILNRLESELSQQFNTRKQKVLMALHTFIKQTSTSNNENNTLLYGSHSFYHVWEVVCKNVFDDVLDLKLGEINLPNGILSSKYKKNKEFKELVCKPSWYGSDNLFVTSSKETMELDTVSIFKYESKWCLSIIDAKYYLTSIMGKSVSHTPGIIDIEKEYFYQMALHEFMFEHDFDKVANCFVMPLPEGVEHTVGEYAGSVSLPMFDNMYFGFDGSDKKAKMCKISVVKLHPLTMYDWYLNGVDRKSEKYKKVLNLILTNAITIK